MRKKVALVTAIAVATVLVAVLGAVFVGMTTMASAQTTICGPSVSKVPIGFKGWLRHAQRFAMKSIEVSQGYNETVMKILEENEEPRSLLSQGYTVKSLMPIVKACVEPDGTVTIKAQQAVVVLSNGDVMTMYLVDIGSGSVTHLATINVGAIKGLGGPCLSPALGWPR